MDKTDFGLWQFTAVCTPAALHIGKQVMLFSKLV